MTRAAVVMAAAAAGLALAAAAEEAKPSGFDIRLPVVEVVDVADFKVKTYPGRVVPVAQVNIVPQVSGEILEVGFENGSVVKEGDVLYVLDSVKYEAAVKSAEAKVAETKALQQYAERNYARHLKLVDSRAVSQDAVDNSLSARDSARAALAAAQADLAEKRDSLDHCRITAPISGKVGTTQYTRGNYVTTSSGTLVTLVQNAPIRVRFSISNRDYLDLFGASGQRIKEEAVLGLSLANGGEYPDPGEARRSRRRRCCRTCAGRTCGWWAKAARRRGGTSPAATSRASGSSSRRGLRRARGWSPRAATRCVRG